MKKFYSFLLVTLMSLISLNASAGQVIVVFNDLQAIDEVQLNGTSLKLPTIMGRMNIDYTDYAYVSIYLKDGYFMKSIVRSLNDETEDIELYSTGAGNFPLNDEVNGSVYLVTTCTEDEFYDQTVTFKSDDYKKYFIQTSTYRTIYPESNEYAVKLAGVDNPVTISSQGSTKIYKVTVNDVEQTERNWQGNISATVKDGDVVEVTTAWPIDPKSVKFSFVGDGDKALKSIYVDGDEITTGFTADDFTINAGSTLGLNLDDTNFKINSVKVNDESTYWYSSWSTTITDATTIEIDATKYEAQNVTITVDDASRVKCMLESPYYGSPLELKDGSNVYEIAATISEIYFKAASGDVYIASITYTPAGEQETPASMDYSDNYKIYLADGMAINITTGAVVLDNHAVVYVKNYANMFDSQKEYPMYGGGMENANRDEIKLNEGYKEFDFSQAHNPFGFYVYGQSNPSASEQNVWVYINDTYKAPEYETGAVYSLTLSDGDVMKVFIDEAPVASDVTFDVSGVESMPEVTRDRVAKLADLSAFKAFQGTEIVIAPTDVDQIKSVKVNDTPVEADKDGKFTVIVNGDTNIAIEGKGSGLTNIDHDNAASPVYYNLKGMSVDNPKGGVFINDAGEKILIK